jgi:hypothetical protein
MDEEFENGIFSDFEKEELSRGYIISPFLSYEESNISDVIQM